MNPRTLLMVSSEFTNWSLEEVHQRLKERKIGTETLKCWVIWNKANNDLDQLKQRELEFGLEKGFLSQVHLEQWRKIRKNGGVFHVESRSIVHNILSACKKVRGWFVH